jgi:hypothetical protein
MRNIHSAVDHSILAVFAYSAIIHVFKWKTRRSLPGIPKSPGGGASGTPPHEGGQTRESQISMEKQAIC